MKTLVVTVTEFAENASEIGGGGADVQIVSGRFVWPENGRYDLVMVFAHPSADGLAWLDGAGEMLAGCEDVARWPLAGAMVFLGVCYGLENTQMQKALLDAGAGAIIAGPGANYGGSTGLLAGSDVMAMALRGAMQAGFGSREAWTIARMYARMAARRGVAGAEDALGFQMVMSSETVSPRRRWGWLGGVAALVMLLIGMLCRGVGPLDLLTFDSPNPTQPVSPVRTATPPPTWTPNYTPSGWDNVTVTPFPTATPCLSCQPTPGAEVVYVSWVPLVYRAYGWGWESDVYVDGIASSGPITGGDAVFMRDSVLAGGRVITLTLVESWSASLSYESAASNNGSVGVGASAVTFTVNESEYGGVFDVTYEGVTGTFGTNSITRVLTVYADGAAIPTVMTETETLSHE